jgi:hypothetical protein
VGFKWEARFAGNMPKMRPTPHETVKAMTIEAGEMGMARFSTKS